MGPPPLLCFSFFSCFLFFVFLTSSSPLSCHLSPAFFLLSSPLLLSSSHSRADLVQQLSDGKRTATEARRWHQRIAQRLEGIREAAEAADEASLSDYVARAMRLRALRAALSSPGSVVSLAPPRG